MVGIGSMGLWHIQFCPPHGLVFAPWEFYLHLYIHQLSFRMKPELFPGVNTFTTEKKPFQEYFELYSTLLLNGSC